MKIPFFVSGNSKSLLRWCVVALVRCWNRKINSVCGTNMSVLLTRIKKPANELVCFYLALGRHYPQIIHPNERKRTVISK